MGQVGDTLSVISKCVDLLMWRSWNFESQIITLIFFVCLLFTEKINFLLVNQEDFSHLKLVLRS